VHLPVIIQRPALRALPFRRFLAAGDLDALAVHQRIGYFPAGFVKVPPSGLAGDTESGGCFFLFEPFKVNESYEFQLIGTQRDALAVVIRATAGLVAP
jgi:hypothetical protein